MFASQSLDRLLSRLGLRSTAQRAWAMYDWANSAMVTVVITAVYPVFFASFAAAGLSNESATLRHSVATTLALAIVALLAPFLGAVADHAPVKKRLLGGFLGLGVVAVGSMYFISRGQWLFASLLFVMANIGANGSFVFYDSLLPHVADRDEIDAVSAGGYAFGYLGGGIVLGLCLLVITSPSLVGLPAGEAISPSDSSLPVRLSLVFVALWWAVFSIPLFRRVSEPDISRLHSGAVEVIRASATEFARTARALGRHKDAFRMLVAFLIYNDGIGTIIRMAAIYGAERGIPSEAIIGSILIVQFVGVPFAFLFGALAKRISAKRAILLGLTVYAGIAVLGYYMSTALHFLILAFLVGTVQGGTQALSRSLFASMIPRESSGRFFGLFAVFEKFAGILGPAIFAAMIVVTGSSRGAILSVIAFFVVGGALLAMVDVEAGRRSAADQTKMT
ncbi:MAG: MFS transporter [Gemmatimonadetes bacterium]|nr:MFS transporter [Gemmatimonadota bacterium]